MKRLVLCVAVVLVLNAVGKAVVVIETVPVGDVGNVGELSGAGAYGIGPNRVCGAVGYAYNIGKYEVTNSQYAEFLNAVAKTDAYGLYSTDMWSDTYGCKIQRNGSSGSFSYSVAGDRANRPVNYVSWYDTLRFANWLHNGQPTGAQSLFTTEDGAYDMLLGASVVRKLGALFFLPSEDEWYKAAYYKGGGTDAGYWDYATQSDTIPTAELPGGTDMVNGSANYPVGGYLDTIYYTTEVGAYSAKPSDSPYGTFDQGGNVSEWNEADMGGLDRGLRGGGFGSAYVNGSALQASWRCNSGLLVEFTHGFRVASIAPIPEPSSLIVWSLIVLTFGGVGWYRRRKA